MRLWYIISDIHGNYRVFRNLLLYAQLIDESNQWIGEDACLFLRIIQVQALLSGNLEKVRVQAVEAAVKYLKGEKVFPILHVENCREMWHLNTETGCIEVCLDEVRYANRDKTQSVQEYGVECEFKTGEPAFLEQIAEALSQQYDLIPTFQSKYERGLRLLNLFGVKGQN